MRASILNNEPTHQPAHLQHCNSRGTYLLLLLLLRDRRPTCHRQSTWDRWLPDKFSVEQRGDFTAWNWTTNLFLEMWVSLHHRPVLDQIKGRLGHTRVGRDPSLLTSGFWWFSEEKWEWGKGTWASGVNWWIWEGPCHINLPKRGVSSLSIELYTVVMIGLWQFCHVWNWFHSIQKMLTMAPTRPSRLVLRCYYVVKQAKPSQAHPTQNLVTRVTMGKPTIYGCHVKFRETRDQR